MKMKMIMMILMILGKMLKHQPMNLTQTLTLHHKSRIGLKIYLTNMFWGKNQSSILIHLKMSQLGIRLLVRVLRNGKINSMKPISYTCYQILMSISSYLTIILISLLRNFLILLLTKNSNLLRTIIEEILLFLLLQGSQKTIFITITWN